jgi:type I restriction enzyme S subunit
MSLRTGAAMPNIKKSALGEFVFNIDDDSSTQNKVVNVLDNISEMLNKKNQQLSEYDQLIKSRFVEMFGTIENTNHRVDTLMNLSEFITDGTHQTPHYTDDKVRGYKFLSSKDVTSGKIDWSNIKYIPEELHNELYNRIAPRKNDILLAKNGTTGTAALVDVDEVFDIYVSLAIIRLKDNTTNPTYILHAINSIDTKRQFNASLKGVGVPNLHLGEIRKAKIIVPDIELQDEFVETVKQIDKLKFEVQKSLDETQMLFDSLMQEYFG